MREEEEKKGENERFFFYEFNTITDEKAKKKGKEVAEIILNVDLTERQFHCDTQPIRHQPRDFNPI